MRPAPVEKDRQVGRFNPVTSLTSLTSLVAGGRAGSDRILGGGTERATKGRPVRAAGAGNGAGECRSRRLHSQAADSSQLRRVLRSDYRHE